MTEKSQAAKAGPQKGAPAKPQAKPVAKPVASPPASPQANPPANPPASPAGNPQATPSAAPAGNPQASRPPPAAPQQAAKTQTPVKGGPQLQLLRENAASSAAQAQKAQAAAKKARAEAKQAQSEAQQAQAELAELKANAFPVAAPAQMRRRHWGLIGSFFLVVLLPLAAAVFYLWSVAEDQYASTAAFTVRSQESSGANDLLGGLASFTGTSTASDSDILYEFIQSQEMVAAVEQKVGLRAHYSRHWPQDWAFALWPQASAEDLTWYWQRIARIAFDSSSGLIEVQATAYDAQTARAITRAIVEESQIRINALNEQARADAMRYAQADLEEAVERLKTAREALTQFRTRTRIVDPEADIQGRMGVMNNLQQQLAEALIEYDLLRGTVGAGDVRVKTARQRIEVIRDRIDIERQTFASDNTETGAVGEDYPSLISEFERLTVDREYAEETYRAALTALELARDDAVRQSRYLATYIKPSLAEEAEYPRRLILGGLAGMFLLLGWAIAALVYYSIRDRS